MADGLGLVFNKQDNTGAAAVLGESANMQPLLDAYRLGAQTNLKDRKPDQALASIGSAMGQAWDNDLPELQEMYKNLTDKLKDYEQTRDQKTRREKWYDIQNEQFALRTYITKSAKNRATNQELEKRFSSDERFRYGQGDFDELDNWRKTKLKDRSDFPKVKAATTQSALQELTKLVKYAPEVKVNKFTGKTGAGSSSYRTIIDGVKLRQAIKDSMPLLPQNFQDAMKVELQTSFIANNPGVAQLSPAEQKAKYDEFMVDRAYAALLPRYKNVTKDAVSLREYGNDGMYIDNGSTSTNKKGIWSLKRTSEDGKYFMGIQPNKTSGVATAPIDVIKVTGTDLKNIIGRDTDNDGNNIDPNGYYTIEGKIFGLTMKEGEKPSIRIQPFDPVSKTLKQGVVKEIALTNENEEILRKYGDDWQDVYDRLKAQADRDWENEKNPAKRTGTSKGAAKAGTAPAPPKASKTPAGPKNYAPKGFPPSSKDFKSMTTEEANAYKSKLTDKQKLEFIKIARKR